MIHLNGDLLCAIDCETTGLKSGHHDIIQFSVLPLGFDLEPSKKHIPLDLKLKPRRPENIDLDALAVTKKTLIQHLEHAIDPYLAADLFDEWFNRLKLPINKKIAPLAHNWPFDRDFIKDWLGPEHFEHYFSHRYRCTLATANFVNDRYDNNAMRAPFPQLILKQLANFNGVEVEGFLQHDALYDCMITAKVYKKMLTIL